MQIITALFSYILGLTLPWRLANAVHLAGWAGRSCKAGVDFYGRPATGIWWHIPPRQRARIVACLVLNAVMHYATQACRVVWYSYDASQTMPGVLWINVTFVLSIVFGVGGGIVQGVYEGGVRKANPDQFPPTPLQHALDAWRKEREEAVQEGRAPPPKSRAVHLAEGLRYAEMRISVGSRRLSRVGETVSHGVGSLLPTLSATGGGGAGALGGDGAGRAGAGRAGGAGLCGGRARISNVTGGGDRVVLRHDDGGAAGAHGADAEAAAMEEGERREASAPAPAYADPTSKVDRSGKRMSACISAQV